MTLQFQYLCPLLQVFDMPASLAFYRDTLGMQLVSAAPDGVTGDRYDWVWLKRDSTNLMLNTAYDPDAVRPPTPEPARVAAHDDTALFFGCADVDGMYAHLRAKGVTTDPPRVASYGMKQLFVSDPDGFNVCFQWPEESE
jgi:catechol 2,3-dioxygenase-like lactoylglutathione lyase family enzyme